MKIYFSGIGGVGIGPLAEIAHGVGFSVVGSDLEQSLMTQKLADNGIMVSFDQSGEFLNSEHQRQAIDWFVYTSALPKNHPELKIAENLGLKISKRDEFLAYVIKQKSLKMIAIAGTHGKTTTTAMTIWAFKQLNIPLSYSVGTTMSFGESGHFDKASRYFVYECDEFDRNFLHFEPFLSLVPSIDYDHPDTYPDQSEYLSAFKKFISQSQKTISWQDQHPEIFDQKRDILLEPRDDKNIKLAGIHNRRNAKLVMTAISELGLGHVDEPKAILSNFPGTDRRFEKLAPNLYSDYGHHPVEIAATLEMARELSNHVVLVYQPHQNIRQHKIKNDYTDQFELAEKIYWLPTYLSREDPNLPILKPEALIQNVTNRSSITVSDFNDELWNNITKALKDNNLVLCMGAGRIDAWVRERLKLSSN